MKFCDPHVTAVRSMVCDLGLEDRISRDETHLRERLAKRNTYDIDPLYQGLLGLRMLANRVVAQSTPGASLIGCPLCVFREEALAAGWIDNVAKAVADLIRRRDAEKLDALAREAQVEEDYRSL